MRRRLVDSVRCAILVLSSATDMVKQVDWLLDMHSCTRRRIVWMANKWDESQYSPKNWVSNTFVVATGLAIVSYGIFNFGAEREVRTLYHGLDYSC